MNSKISNGTVVISSSGDNPTYNFSVALSEIPALVKALGVLATTGTLPTPPDELTFSPFQFKKTEDSTYILSRNDTSASGWVTLKIREIDDLQKMLQQHELTIIDRVKQKGRVMTRF